MNTEFINDAYTVDGLRLPMIACMRFLRIVLLTLIWL